MLFILTVLVNFFFLVAAVWLGVYLVTRSPRRLLVWLSAITLWSIGGLFLNVLLALNPPPIPETYSWWLRLMMPFWPAGALESGASGWLQGWLIAPALATWHHVTVLMRPKQLTKWRLARILFGYIGALGAIIVHLKTPLVFDSVSGDPLYLNAMRAGPLYTLFLGLILLFTGMCLINLTRSARNAPQGVPKKQFNILILATLIAGLAAPIAVLGSAFGLKVPMGTLSLLLGIAICLLGFGVARYSALVDGRTIRRDFIYNAVAMAFIMVVYLIATWMSVQLYNVPPVAFIFVVVLAIISHSVIDFTRLTLDRIFYKQDNRRLRAGLRSLAGQVGENAFEEKLELALRAICETVKATYGLVLLFEKESLRLAASYNWSGSVDNLKPPQLLADDVYHLEPNSLPSSLAEAVLLVPLYAETQQIGAVVLGRPVNGMQYSVSDVETLLYPSDLMVDAIFNAQRESEYLNKLAELTKAGISRSDRSSMHIPVKLVELALRNLYDYAYLGDSDLGALKLVRKYLPPGPVTHLDKGKSINKLITDAIDKLKPEAVSPGDPVPREWHFYMILHGAYIEDKLNRDIMSRLYISEGTFNRTRRSAIRSVARVLEEMEAAIN